MWSSAARAGVSPVEEGAVDAGEVRRTGASGGVELRPFSPPFVPATVCESTVTTKGVASGKGTVRATRVSPRSPDPIANPKRRRPVAAVGERTALEIFVSQVAG